MEDYTLTTVAEQDNSWLTEQEPVDYEPKPKAPKKPKGEGKRGRPGLELPASIVERVEDVVPFGLTAPDATAARALIFKIRQVAAGLGRGLNVDRIVIDGNDVKQSDIAKTAPYGEYVGTVVIGFLPKKEPQLKKPVVETETF